MKQRELSTGSPPVGAIGLGCMGMSWAYGEAATDAPRYIEVIRAAVERGVTLVDTADAYGDGDNETLIGQALAGIRGQVTLATKVGMVVEDRATLAMRPDGSPEHIRQAVDASLKRLGTDVIDLYYLHRVDPEVPLEDSWGAMAEQVAAGKVRRLGLSEVTVEQVRTAHRIFPVSVVESEMSLWSREPLGDRAWPAGSATSGAAEGTSDASDGSGGPTGPDGTGPDGSDGGVLGWCAANGAGFVAYAPLGRGFLTGAITDAGFGGGDFRADNPRFGQDAIDSNQVIVEAIKKVAARYEATPAQIALAWILAKGDHVVPIPGSDRQQFLEENAAAADIELSPQDRQDLDALPEPVGARY